MKWKSHLWIVVLAVVLSSLSAGHLAAAPASTHQDEAFLSQLAGLGSAPEAPISSDLAKPWQMEPHLLAICIGAGCRTNPDCVAVCPAGWAPACCHGGACGAPNKCFLQ